VQSTVRPRDMGVATSALQFSRSIGGALGVSVMGAVFSWRLTAHLAAAGVGAAVSVGSLLHPVGRPASSGVLAGSPRDALAGAMPGVFFVAVVAAALGLVATAFAPRGRIDQLVAQRAGVGYRGRPTPAGASRQ